MLVRSYSEKESQLKKRTKQPSEKDVLFYKVQELFQKSNSIKELKQLLKQHNIKSYDRGGKLTGVFYGKRKYRLKRSLGIDPSLLLLKDKTLQRTDILSSLRQGKNRSKGLSRER